MESQVRTNKDKCLLVWDSHGVPPQGDWVSILWQGYEIPELPDVVSILTLVENQADDLRARYLAWIHDLGETQINGQRLVDHLELRPGFSAWWMSLLTEKCNFQKSPHIDNAIKLLMFDMWASDLDIEQITIASVNDNLIQCVREWCECRGVFFSTRVHEAQIKKISFETRLFISYLPHFLQGGLWLSRYIIQRWQFKGVGLPEWSKSIGKLTFVSYMYNLDPAALAKGRFQSRYWANLPDILNLEEIKTNWLHWYVKDEQLPTAGAASKTVNALNQTGLGCQIHATIDSFLSFRILLRITRDWLRLRSLASRLSINKWVPRVGSLNLWPLFESDWQRSFFGAIAMQNALTLNLFESAFNALPKQDIGVYVQEGQGWEFALNFAWKASGHGRIVGMVHTPVKFWDLRNFYDVRSYTRTGRNDLPMADLLALNGSEAVRAYISSGYPESGLIETEALRYLHLINTGGERMPTKKTVGTPLRLLVLGDYLFSSTSQQLKLLEQAAPSLPKGTIVLVKPHPNSPVCPTDFPGLSMTITSEPIFKLLAESDVAYTGSTTSAAVDAYCAGVPVVSVLDRNALNLSPLRGREGVVFVSTTQELIEGLFATSGVFRESGKGQDFFTLDSSLARWRHLLVKKEQ